MSEVVIVGAGLAGLGCALRLQEAGVDYILVDSSDAVGGRVRTDVAGGFQFDRGFQVFLTSYPEARRVLDYGMLDLRPFEPGCMIFWDGQFHHFADPWRRPSKAIGSLFGPIGTMADKMRIARLRWRVTSSTAEALLNQPELSTARALESAGFSEDMIEVFFRPFLGGIFLERELATSSRKFHWVFRMFSTGRATVPAWGMGAIPAQLASRLPAERILLNAAVRRIGQGVVSLEDGRDLLCAQAVVATDPATAVRLVEGLPSVRCHRTTNLYYSLGEAPVKGPWLLLNGEDQGIVNNLTFLSEVAREYAPKGRTLASVTVLGETPANDRELDDMVRRQLIDWFGMIVGDWRLERVYRISEALPEQPGIDLSENRRVARLQDWLVAAGDWRNVASINGALESGRLAAEAVLEKILV